eukprot:30294-Pelagococcus_subviridis.AAC.41
MNLPRWCESSPPHVELVAAVHSLVLQLIAGFDAEDCGFSRDASAQSGSENLRERRVRGALQPAVFFPLAAIFRAVCVRAHAVAVSHIAHPLAFVHVLAREGAISLPVPLTVLPVPFVNGSIRVQTFPISVFLPFLPLADVFPSAR